jgi:GNAT superfamily N-acetyltransferase
VTVVTDTVPRSTLFPPVRRLVPQDQGGCVALSIDRGWSPERPKWGLLLATCEVYGIDAPDGRGLAGAVVLTRYGAGLASVGMMLVAARYERRGLGRALMEYALRAAGDDVTVTLFATSLGRPLYEKLGFVPVRRSASFIGRFRADADQDQEREAPGGVRAATPADRPAILALDREAFGADRSPVLTRVAALADRVAVATRGGAVTGYGFAWRNDAASTLIGPLVAPDGGTARRLAADLAGQARTPARLDLDPDRTELPGWAERHGLALGGVTTVMAHGPDPERGLPGHLYTPVSVALA